jgi:hypothetical protein
LDYREKLPSDLTSSLDTALDGSERPVDRLTAFSLSDRAGTQIWRYRAGDNEMSPSVIEWLAKKAKTTKKIATVSLWLYLWGHRCWQCHGKKHEFIGAKVVSCPTCKGLGYVRLRDRQLAALLDEPVEVARRAWKAIQRCLDTLSNADRRVSVTMSLRLVE